MTIGTSGIAATYSLTAAQSYALCSGEMGTSSISCFKTDKAAARGSAAAGFIIGLVAARVRQQRLRQLYLLVGLLGYAARAWCGHRARCCELRRIRMMGSHVSIHTVQMLVIFVMLAPLDSNADLNTTAKTTSFLFVMISPYC